MHGKSRRDPNNGDPLEECRIVDRKFIEIFPIPPPLFPPRVCLTPAPAELLTMSSVFNLPFHSPLLQPYKTVLPHDDEKACIFKSTLLPFCRVDAEERIN